MPQQKILHADLNTGNMRKLNEMFTELYQGQAEAAPVVAGPRIILDSRSAANNHVSFVGIPNTFFAMRIRGVVRALVPGPLTVWFNADYNPTNYHYDYIDSGGAGNVSSANGASPICGLMPDVGEPAQFELIVSPNDENIGVSVCSFRLCKKTPTAAETFVGTLVHNVVSTLNRIEIGRPPGGIGGVAEIDGALELEYMIPAPLP